MMEENARVVALQTGFVWAETERKSACGACSLNKGCGSAVLARLMGSRRTRIKAMNTLPVAVGDEVVLGLAEDALIRGSLVLYALPLLTLLLGAFIGEYASSMLRLESGETWVMLCALAGLGAGFAVVRVFARRISDDARYQPVVLRRTGVHQFSG